MASRRLRIFFPNFPMQVMPQGNHLATNGVIHLRTTQNKTKSEIKAFLQAVYGVDVMKVNTINYDGRRKRSPYSGRSYRTTKYKKAVVTVDNTYFLDLLSQQELGKKPTPPGNTNESI